MPPTITPRPRPANPVTQVRPDQIYTTATGERRVRLSDIRGAGLGVAPVRRFTLAEILMGDTVLEGDGGEEIRLKPINLKGMRGLTAILPGLGAPGAPPETEPATVEAQLQRTIEIAHVLVNQDRDEGDEVPIDAVSRIINVENVPLVERLVRELITPLLAGPSLPPTSSGARTVAAVAGSASSRSSPSGAGGGPGRSRPSR